MTFKGSGYQHHDWIGEYGRGEDVMEKLIGYHRRSLVETAFSRFKGIFGDQLFSKRFDSQEIELNIKSQVLNRMTRIGMPKGRIV